VAHNDKPEGHRGAIEKKLEYHAREEQQGLGVGEALGKHELKRRAEDEACTHERTHARRQRKGGRQETAYEVT